MMWQQILHPSAGAVKDYSLAGVLISSPAWVSFFTTINPFLSFIAIGLGIWLGVRRDAEPASPELESSPEGKDVSK